jgi:hypothetical protein
MGGNFITGNRREGSGAKRMGEGVRTVLNRNKTILKASFQLREKGAEKFAGGA